MQKLSFSSRLQVGLCSRLRTLPWVTNCFLEKAVAVFREKGGDVSGHISGRVSRRDDMYSIADPLNYFLGGLDAYGLIKTSVDEVLGARVSGRSPCILDFPSGYGRVLRFLRAGFPNSVIVASDIHCHAVAFCAEQFSVIPVVSQEQFKNVCFPCQFDLIFCGSLLTHLHERRCLEVLKLFDGNLRSGGVVIFTTHGAKALAREGSKLQDIVGKAFVETGFYFNGKEEMEYGTSWVTPSWIRRHVSENLQWEEKKFLEGRWTGVQDVWVFQKMN